jgi:hypothetical protein
VKVFTKRNFHSHTFCLWEEVPVASIEGMNPNYLSKSGSRYIFTESGVYRISNHWGRAANCRWRLKPLKGYKNQQTKVGYANWGDFFPNDDTLKQYYIKVDFDIGAADFYHQLGSDYDAKAVLRNANAAMKTIKIIKQVLTEKQWARHLQFDDINVLRQEIVHELIYSETSFLAIKQKHHQL